eukprot:PhF_6_TR12970/c0_g1_i1/m.20497/K01738/cysK; cysteine synthase A
MSTILVDRNNAIANDMSELIGQTPMVYLNTKNFPEVKGKVALKLECENPMASVKDRLGLGIIREAEKRGEIIPGKTTLIEATSGNTGIALAHIGACRGYKVVLVMPETMSQERRCLLKILGADIVLTPGAKGMKGAIFWAEKLAKETPNGFLTSQFDTPYNAQIHYETTGPEVWQQTQGKIDYFVAGVGTGGTLAGVLKYIKERKADCKFVAVEPQESPVLSGGKPGPHKIQGIGAGFIPKVLEPYMSQLSEVLPVPTDAALDLARKLPVLSGVFCGISGGANIQAAITVASRPENAGKLVVAIVPSFGERYLSTALFDATRQECAALPVLGVELFP